MISDVGVAPELTVALGVLANKGIDYLLWRTFLRTQPCYCCCTTTLFLKFSAGVAPQTHQVQGLSLQTKAQ